MHLVVEQEEAEEEEDLSEKMYKRSGRKDADIFNSFVTTPVGERNLEENTRDALNPKPQNLHIFFSSRAKNRKAEPRARVQFHAHPKSLTHLACVLITRTLTLTQISSASSLLRKEEIERRGLVLF